MSTRAATTTMHSLDFKEKLLEKGKRETAEGLSRKLKLLYQKLQQLEQDQTDTKSLDPVRKPLIDNLILHHKDRGVKAYAACCLAEMLRLYAPDAPYTAQQLQSIFEFFLAQLLEGLRPPPTASRPLQPSKRTNTQDSQSQSQSQSGTASQRIADAPYYTEYCLLLESLATIKSIVLACDVPKGDDLMVGYFTGFVQIVRSDMSKSVIRHMGGILVALLEESSSAVPSGVLDCIIDQFTRYASTREPSFLMIVDVCNQVSKQLHRPIYAHFAEIQLQHGKNPTAEDMDVMVQSHKLLLTIWRNTPDLLPLVLPTLEANLKAADEAEIRALTTRTLGSMFSIRPRVGQSMAELSRSHPTTWKAWLGRKVDKVVAVRVAWVESTYDVLAEIGDLRRELEAELIDRVADGSEQVRAAICKVIGKLDYETALNYIQEATLKDIGLRLNDKKPVVRNEAADALCKLWSAAYTEIESNEDRAVQHFAWIPQALISSTQLAQLPVEHRTALAAKFKAKILPLPAKADDDQAWVERLLLVASHLDEATLNGLDRLTGLVGFARGSSPYRAFAQTCEAWNGGIVDKDEASIKARLNFIANAIAGMHFAEPEKAKKDLQAFADTNDHRLFKLLNACANPESDLRTIIKAKNELARRVEQSHTDLLDCVNVLIDNGAFNVINSTSVSSLLRTLQSPPNSDRRDDIVRVAARFLGLLSKECPPMYIAHVPELLIAIGQQKNEKLVEISLQALASVCKYQPSVAPKDNKYVEKAKRMALNGTPRQAKFAARFMAYCGHEGASEELVESIMEELDPSDDSIISHLRALAELALSSPKALETKANEVHEFVMRKVIHAKSIADEDDAMDEWKPEEELDRVDRAKLLGLRLITYRVIGFARDPEALKVAEPVFQLLDNILQGEGQISEKTEEGGYAKTQIRLRAALCLIKLAQVKSFDRKMTRFFEPISYIMQDPCFQVRHRLLLKMALVLPTQRMYARWNIMPAMIATDPEEDNVQLARRIIGSCIVACQYIPAEERIDRIEMPLARLLLVLAHHPDLDQEEGDSLETLKIIAKYIDFYIECVVNRDNVGLLYHIAAKVKSVKGLAPNGEPDEDNTNLYKLAEIAQGIIRNKSDARHWALTTYPGKIRMPRDCFHNLQNNQLASETMRRNYLSEEESEWLKTFGKKNASAGPSRRIDPMSSPPPKRKPKTKSAPRKRARRSGDTSDESESDDDDEDEDEDMEESEEETVDEDEEEVVGRGGRRGAKTKAKKGLRGKRKSKGAKDAKSKRASTSASPDKKKAKRAAEKSSDVESDLTAVEDDEE